MPHSFPQRRPLLFVGLLLLLALGTFLITSAMNAIWHQHSIVFTCLGESVLGLVAVLLLSRFRWWRVAGFRMPRYSPALFCLLAPCFILITEANSIFYWWDYLPGRNNALLFAVFVLLVGFVEETYFRGMILRALLVRGPWFAATVSSILFGGLHLLHLIEGQNLTATLLQVAMATAKGLLFAAVALRTQSILPLIVIHGLTDFMGFVALNGTLIAYTPSSGDILESAIEVLIYVTLAVFAMRGLGTEECEPDPNDGRDRALVESGI